MTNLSKNSIRWFFLTGVGFATVSAIVEILSVFQCPAGLGNASFHRRSIDHRCLSLPF